MGPLERANQFYDATIGRASKGVSKFLSRTGERIARINKNVEILSNSKEPSTKKKARTYTSADNANFPSVNKAFDIATSGVEAKLSNEEYRQIIGELFTLLKENGGLKSVGIFRLSPSIPKFKKYITEIKNGNSPVDIASTTNMDEFDVNIFAHCIKKLCLENLGQDPAINSLLTTEIDDLKDAKNALPQETLTALNQILDIIREVAKENEFNLMPADNLALLFSTNLFSDPSAPFTGPPIVGALIEIRNAEDPLPKPPPSPVLRTRKPLPPIPSKAITPASTAPAAPTNPLPPPSSPATTPTSAPDIIRPLPTPPSTPPF